MCMWHIYRCVYAMHAPCFIETHIRLLLFTVLFHFVSYFFFAVVTNIGNFMEMAFLYDFI